MADDAEDVLELDTDLELDVLDDEEPDSEEQTDGEVAEDEGEELYGFDDDGAAPAQETESSVIRDLRKALREKDKRLAALERQHQPQVAALDPGPEPDINDFHYDQDVWKVEWDAWKARVDQFNRANREAEERAEAERKIWQGVTEAYEADKKTLKVSNFDEAEEEVFAALSEQHQALLMKSGKGAPLVVALHRNPAKLQELSKMNLADAAMMIGELRAKLQMTKRSTATPERRLAGNTGFAGGTDKQLKRLEEEAARTGDRTKLIRYRKQLAERAKS